MGFKFGKITAVFTLVFICALAAACGGKGYKYPGMALAPDPTDPGSTAVYPQEGGKASVTGKTVTFNAGGSETPDYVFGGVSPDEGVAVTNNTVTVNGGEIAEHAYGGYSQEGTALNNTLTINGGKMLSAFAGGSRMDSSNNTLYLNGGALRIDRDGDSAFAGYAWGGKANNNKLVVTGGDLPGDIYGGWARKDSATGNTVEISGNPNIGAAVYAGYIDDAQPGDNQDYVTGNKIFIKDFSGKIPMLRNAELVSIASSATVIFPDAQDVQISGVSRLLNEGAVVLESAPVVWQNTTYFGTGRIVWNASNGDAGLTLDTGILEVPLKLEVTGNVTPMQDKPIVILMSPTFSKNMDRKEAVQLVNTTAGGLTLSLTRVVDGNNDVWKLTAK